MTNVYTTKPDEQPNTAAAISFAGPMAVNQQTPSEELPCEKYRQFMDSSVQERTFMIEKLVGKSLRYFYLSLYLTLYN